MPFYNLDADADEDKDKLSIIIKFIIIRIIIELFSGYDDIIQSKL